ncbi:CDK5 regulatory subunit-associated protein 3-like isoform X1 [Oscarella lobularis]|uniref:CDK5 regulatory subunit-associated protein 3-like isoform X1 n=1 Tax=Oscarella lobularis TaxID=121494 RepID=UPI0033136B47
MTNFFCVGKIILLCGFERTKTVWKFLAQNESLVRALHYGTSAPEVHENGDHERGFRSGIAANRHPLQQTSRLADRSQALHDRLAIESIRRTRENQRCSPRYAPSRRNDSSLTGILYQLFSLLANRRFAQSLGSGYEKFFRAIFVEKNEAESASMLARNVNYEIPATKRQIGRCQQIQRECSRKESECAANAVQLRKKFSALCKELKIEGNDVKRELKKLVDELPSVYESVCCGIKELEQCVKYYEEFVLFIAPSASESEILLMIKFIQSHGNATVYQWKTGKIPDKVLAPVIQATMEEEEQSGNISWGDSEAIDFGDADINCADIAKEIEVAGGVDLDVGGIDFGDDEQEAQGEIDWGNGEIQVESAGSREDDGILVTGDDAESVIAYTQTRGHLVDELLELETFFSQRLKELDEEPSIVSTNLFQSASELLQLQTADSISGMRSKVAAVLQTLTSSRMQHLFMIKNSQTYIDRLADSLTHKLTLANKMETALQAAKDRAAAAAREQADLEPKLEAMRQKTKELQKQLEQSLSKRYNNRIVNIMGEINSI